MVDVYFTEKSSREHRGLCPDTYATNIGVLLREISNILTYRMVQLREQGTELAIRGR